MIAATLTMFCGSTIFTAGQIFDNTPLTVAGLIQIVFGAGILLGALDIAS